MVKLQIIFYSALAETKRGKSTNTKAGEKQEDGYNRGLTAQGGKYEFIFGETEHNLL